MPTTVKTTTKKTYRKGYGRNRRKFKKLKKKVNHGAWLKIPTIGFPYNLITFLKYSSKTYNYTVPQLDSGPGSGSPLWTANGTGFCIGLNLMNPVNLVHSAGNIARPADDISYFGPIPTSSSEGALPNALSRTYVYSQLTWFAKWYRRLRVTHVWVKTTIRPVQDVPGQPGQTDPLSSRDPITVTVFDSKYIAGINTPDILALKDQDDLRATRGAKTMVFSGQRSKPIVIYRKVSIKKLLGVKDLMDTGYETQCTINDTLNTTGGQLTNPTVRNACFEYIRVGKLSNTAQQPANTFMRFAIQWEIVAKVHFSQLNPNNPTSFIGSTGEPEDPNADTAQNPV